MGLAGDLLGRRTPRRFGILYFGDCISILPETKLFKSLVRVYPEFFPGYLVAGPNLWTHLARHK